jgi:RND family efflux transporter MFP subunit
MRVDDKLLRMAVPPAIVLIGVVVAIALLRTGPTAARKPVEERAAVVRFEPAVRAHERIHVVAMGTVIPAREVVLRPEVDGRIVEQNPKLVPGGHVAEGEVLIRIDPREYELAVEEQKAAVSSAEFELKVETGRQTIAEHEWELLERDIRWTKAGRELALRKPHMVNATVAVEAARSGLARAQLELERTIIRAPFNAIVQYEAVDVGQMVSGQTELATLVGTDRFWVRASVPVDRLRWIRFPAPDVPEGSRVRIVQDAGLAEPIERAGSVFGLLGDLEPQGRLARVLVTVDDPLSLVADSGADLPLLVGAYVRVEVEGPEVEEVIAVSRNALREGGRVWIIDDQDRLLIRDVDIAWRHQDRVLVRSGLAEGERVIISPLSTPVPGMALRADASVAPVVHLKPAGEAGGMP